MKILSLGGGGVARTCVRARVCMTMQPFSHPYNTFTNQPVQGRIYMWTIKSFNNWTFPYCVYGCFTFSTGPHASVAATLTGHDLTEEGTRVDSNENISVRRFHVAAGATTLECTPHHSPPDVCNTNAIPWTAGCKQRGEWEKRPCRFYV